VTRTRVLWLVVPMTLVWIVLLAPATLLVGPAQVAGLQLYGVDGTLWRGAVDRAMLRQPQVVLDIGELQWQWLPSRLIQGQLCADVQSRARPIAGQLQSVDARACLQTNGTVLLSQASADMPAAVLWREESVRLLGHLALQLVEPVALQAGSAVARTRGLWSQAGITVLGQGTRDHIDVGEVALDVAVTMNNGQVSEVQLRLSPIGNQSITLPEWLALMLEQDESGSYLFNWQS